MNEPSPAVAVDLAAQRAALQRLARDLLHDSHVADDAAQEAMLRALQRPPRAPAVLGVWLRTVLTRWVRDRRRGETRRVRHEANLPPRVDDGATTVERVELQQRVLAAVRALPEPYRTAIWLRYYDDIAPAAIAAARGEPVKTVKTRLSRGLALLRQALDAGPGGRAAWCAALLPMAPARAASGLATAGAVRPALGVAMAAAAVVLCWFVFAAADPVPGVSAPLVSASASADAGPDAGAAAGVTREVPVTETDLVAGLAHQVLLPAPAVPLPLGGLVIDVDGRPVPEVELTWNGAAFTPPLVSDAHGRFAGTRVPACGSIAVAGVRHTTVLAPVLFDQDQAHPELTVVVAAAVAFAGIVRDEAGEPLAAASVQVVAAAGVRTRLARVFDRCIDTEHRATTAADGRFAFAAAPRTADATVAITAAGYHALRLPLDEACQRGEFVLTRAVPGDRLAGVVVDAVGAPVAGACVTLHDVTVAADDAGAFDLPAFAVGAVPEGVVPRLVATSPRHVPGELAALGPDWRTRGAWPVPLRVTIGAPGASIRGRVRRSDGSPVPDPFVTFASPHPPCVGTPLGQFVGDAEPVARTEGGFVTWSVAPGRYVLWVCDAVTLEMVATPPLPTGPDPVDIVLPSGPRWPALHCVVVDRRGKVVPGADWVLERDDPMPGATAPRTSNWQQATADGVIAHPPCSRDVHTLCVKAAGAAEWVRVRLADLPRPDDARIVVPVRCQACIELVGDAAGIDRATLCDARGEPSAVVFTFGNEARGTRHVPLAQGRSQTFTALDDCVQLQLWRGQELVRTVPITLQPEGLNTLRP